MQLGTKIKSEKKKLSSLLKEKLFKTRKFTIKGHKLKYKKKSMDINILRIRNCKLFFLQSERKTFIVDVGFI